MPQLCCPVTLKRVCCCLSLPRPRSFVKYLICCGRTHRPSLPASPPQVGHRCDWGVQGVLSEVLPRLPLRHLHLSVTNLYTGEHYFSLGGRTRHGVHATAAWA
jgi:hypothetical protein